MCDYLMYGITYDKNGNTQTLKRLGQSPPGWLDRDNMTYNYIQNTIPTGGSLYNQQTNQLSYVADASALPTGSTPASLAGFLTQSAGNYSYDAIGEVTDDAGSGTSYIYNAAGKVTEADNDQNGLPKMRIQYDEAGTRFCKITYDATGAEQKRDYYLTDAGGTLMSIYEQDASNTLRQTQLPIYGASMLGTAFVDRSGGQRTFAGSAYQLTDHLGNVRAVISGTLGSDGFPQILSTNDYYAYGTLMPGRSFNPPGTAQNRYGYQGQEIDPETGLYAFDLRMYHTDLGRWLSPDPMQQHWSPYMAMSNNPISFTDPTGGIDGVDDDNVTYYVNGMQLPAWAAQQWFTITQNMATANMSIELNGPMFSGMNDPSGFIYSPHRQQWGTWTNPSTFNYWVDQTGNVVAIGSNEVLNVWTSLLGMSDIIARMGQGNNMNSSNSAMNSTISTAQPNAFGKLKNYLNSPTADNTVTGPDPYEIGAKLIGKTLYSVANNAKITLSGVGSAYPTDLEGFGVNRNQHLDAAVGSLQVGVIALIGPEGELMEDGSMAEKVLTQDQPMTMDQFTESTIDQGINRTMKEKSTHIFDGTKHPKPYLDVLANSYGGRQGLIEKILNTLNGQFPAQGFFELNVTLGGQNLTVRGWVNNGVPIINTIF